MVTKKKVLLRNLNQTFSCLAGWPTTTFGHLRVLPTSPGRNLSLGRGSLPARTSTWAEFGLANAGHLILGF